MQQQRTELVSMGAGLSLHLPVTRPLTPRLLGDLEFAMTAAAEGHPSLAKGLIVSFEERFGVNDFDRIQHGDRQAKARRLTGLATKLAERRAKAPPAERTIDPEAVTENEIDSLARADGRIARARKSGDRKALVKAAKSKGSVLDQMERRATSVYMAARTEELGQLEALRGGRVVVEERDIDTPVLKDGAPVWDDGIQITRRETVSRARVTNRDGLETLTAARYDAAGKMVTPPVIFGNQRAAADHYRFLAEAVDVDRSLTPPDIERSGSSASESPAHRALKRLAKHDRQYQELVGHDAAVRAAVTARKSAEAGADAVYVLREVIGKGMTIRSLSTSGARRDKLTKLLLEALDLIADRMGLQ